MITLQNPSTQRKHERQFDKLISQGRYAEANALTQEHNRILAINEQIPCSEITKYMTPEDHEYANLLLRKCTILSDVVESAAIDLQELIRRYDKYVTLPLVAQCRGLRTLAYNIRAIVDAVGNTEYSETFGDLCDTINNLIDRAFEIEKEKLAQQENNNNNINPQQPL